MTRTELLAVAKPILFNTEMVRAIKDNRKTVTRRVVKPQPNYEIYWKGGISYFEKVPCDGGWYGRQLQPQYNWDDVLYVSEAWRCTERCTSEFYEIEFRGGEKIKVEFADEVRRQKWLKYIDKPRDHWQSPYFMPKEAARIFLRVTDVRVERLKDMTAASAMAEGFTDWNDVVRGWDSTIKPADRSLYGWGANPWVWCYEFERVEAGK